MLCAARPAEAAHFVADLPSFCRRAIRPRFPFWRNRSMSLRIRGRQARHAKHSNHAIWIARNTGTRARRVFSAKATAAMIAGLCLLPAAACAQSSYYRHTFFDNGPRTAAYYYSSGKAVAPSTLETVDAKLPLDMATFLTGPNSLKVAWESRPGGAWAAHVGVLVFRNRDFHFDGDTLSFWVYAPEAIRRAAMPRFGLLDMA